MKYLVKILALFAVLCIQLAPASARIVDPTSPPDALLDTLADALDARGINVRRGAASPTALDVILGGPTVTRLNNLPTAGQSIVGSDFRRHFEAGAFDGAFLLAVGSNRPVAITSKARLLAQWKAADRSKRVFVSFSGSDVKLANQLAAALHVNGYATFLYKGSKSEKLQFNSVEVGAFFRESEHHLVIDTDNARRSEAVIIEALAAKFLAANPLPGSRNNPNLTIDPNYPIVIAPQVKDPCCKLCRYVNGVPMGCGPIECGPQCLNARKAPITGLESLFAP